MQAAEISTSNLAGKQLLHGHTNVSVSALTWMQTSLWLKPLSLVD